jgi:hypothetical protein
VRRLALVVLALALCGACKVDLAVNVDAHDDGTGVVTARVALDQEAAQRLKALGGRLDADDLRKAGWRVTKTDTSIVATKPFANPDEVPGIIGEAVGARRPLRDFRLTRTRSAFRTDTKFRGTVDLTAGLNAFSDDKLPTQAGADLAQLARRSNDILNEIFSVQVGVRLPGDVDSNAPTAADNGAVWRPKLGERITLTASASQLDTRRIVYIGVALTAGLALLLQVVRILRRHGQDKDASPLH